MESLRKAKEEIDGLLKIADFLKEAKEIMAKFGDLPAQIVNWEQTKKSLIAEVDDLNKQKAQLKTDIESERAAEINSIRDKTRELDSLRSIVDQERIKIQNEASRMEVRENELKQLISSYEKATQDAQELQWQHLALLCFCFCLFR